MHTGFPSEVIRATFPEHCIYLIIYLKNKKIDKSGPVKPLVRAILSDQVQKGEEISFDSKFTKFSIFRARITFETYSKSIESGFDGGTTFFSEKIDTP